MPKSAKQKKDEKDHHTPRHGFKQSGTGRFIADFEDDLRVGIPLSELVSEDFNFDEAHESDEGGSASSSPTALALQPSAGPKVTTVRVNNAPYA